MLTVRGSARLAAAIAENSRGVVKTGSLVHASSVLRFTDTKAEAVDNLETHAALRHPAGVSACKHQLV